MRPILRATLLAAVAPFAAAAQEAVGTIDLRINGDERTFLMVQGGDGANPGSRFSRLGGDVVLNLVAVSGDTPMPPEEANERIELRFTAAEGGEVRTGSILSYTTRDSDGLDTTRGVTSEVALEELSAQDTEVSAQGTFTAELPPDAQSDAATIEGAFRTTMKRLEERAP